MFDAIKQTAQGAAILKDWLGDGGEPVTRLRAEARSSPCLNCPHNVAPKWWEQSKAGVAEVIRQHLEVKNQVGLTLANEDRLHMCKICGCCNTLSVWCPIEHIQRHTKEETLNKFPDFCWKKIEINELQQSH